MGQVIKIVLLLVVVAGAVGWYIHSRGTNQKPSESGSPTASGANGKPGSQPPPAVPVAVAKVRVRDIPIFLDGLGTVQALQTVTVHPQIEGRVETVDFVEGQDVHVGQLLATIDARTYKAQLDQANAKKQQDKAKTDQDRAKTSQDKAHKMQDQALEKQSAARKAQDEALVKQAEAKKKQDDTNLANARVNLGRFEESLKGNAVSEQVVTDQRSQVSQLESLVSADESSIQAVRAAVQGDEVATQAVQAAVQGDEAAVQADMAAVAGDEASVAADEAAIQYAEAFLSYATIKSPINGRTGVRQVDVGNLIRTNDVNGIVVLTQLQPLSVIFTLPQQNLQDINDALRKQPKLTVIAVESQGKSKIAGRPNITADGTKTEDTAKIKVSDPAKVESDDSDSLKNLDSGGRIVLDVGELLLVDNQIDPTTGTIRLKATFPNKDFKLWPGGFVDVRLRLEIRKSALVVKSPAIQQGPNGTFVFLIKPDETVEMRAVRITPTADGKSIVEEGLAADDEVVLSGHDRLKNGTKVSVDRSRQKPADGGAKDTSNHRAQAAEGTPQVTAEKAATQAQGTSR